MGRRSYYTFTSKSWEATSGGSAANWTSGGDGNELTTGRGVQVTTGASGANATSPVSFTNVSKIVVTYSTNASKGAGSISFKIGDNTAVSQNVTKTGGTTDRTLEYDFNPNQSGSVLLTVTCTTNSIYVKSVAITYTSGPTSTVSTPTFSPSAGTYYAAQEVTINCGTDGATIYYTTDGTTPTTSSTTYSAPLNISATTTVKAMATKTDYENSEVATAVYTINDLISGYSINFEAPAEAYTDWTFTNMESQQTGNVNITAHGGTYYGTTGGKATASIQTKTKVANPGTLTCYVSKQSTNTTSSTWYAQVSSDGSSWTDVASRSATDMTRGEWVEFTADLSSYSNVYVRIYYSGSTAVRNIDDLSLTMASTDPSISASDVDITYDATNGSIGCTINHAPTPAGTLTAAIAQSPASTIEGLTIGTINGLTVPYSCSANNTTTARTATVTLTYTYGDNQTTTKDVVITQAAHPTPSITAANVEINYNSIGGNIAYTINDGIEGGSVSASVPNNSWITLPNTFASPIVFTCEATEGVVARTETVTLTYTFNSNQSVAKEVTVTQGVDATLGTADHPYTVAQALEAAAHTGVYVTGTISQIDEVNTTYYNATYWISIDGSTNNQMKIYRGKYLNNANFTATNQIQTGDRVKIYGDLVLFNNANQIQNNYIVSLDRDATITVANTNIEVNAIAGQSTINVTYNNFGTETILADVTYYEDDGETVVTNPGTVYPWFVAEINNANNVKCTYVEHTGNTARTAYFKVWAYYDDNMNENEIVYSDLVTFTQRTPAQTQYPITKTATLAGTILVKDVNNNELTEALPNTEVYLTFEAADCQTFNTWTVSNTSTNPATSVTVTDGHFTMPAGAVTVTANTTASPVLEYLYVVNGVNGEEQSTCISPLSLPTTVETPRGFRFVGWTTDEDDVDNIITSYSFDADEMVFFYAVFAHLEGGVYTYQRITSNNSLSDGNYLIVYENENGSTIHDGGLYDLNASSNYIDVAVGEGNVINGTSAINNATFTIASYGQTDDKYSIQSTSGKYMGKLTDSNGMDQNVTMSNNLANTIGFSGNNCDIVGAGGTHLRYNSSATTFRYYKSNTYTNQKAIQLYKQTVVEAGSTVRYTRVLNTNPTENVTITVPTIINSGTVLNMNGQTLTCNNPANLIIEDGGQLICSNSVAATVQKSITAPTTWSEEDNSGWYAISSTVGSLTNLGDVNNLTPATVGDVTQYDLYKYVEGQGWINQHAHNDFGGLINGHGYLYARKDGATLSFIGNTTASDVTVEGLTATGNGPLAGIHLLGNPYTHDIYKGVAITATAGSVSTGYYKLDGANLWVAADDATPIAAGQGFLVQVTDGTTVKMTNNANSPSAKSNNDYIKFMVNNDLYEDVTYAWFDKGEGLNKISHRNDKAPMVYINQDGENFAIATMEDNTQTFNLNFKAATTGRYTLSYDTKGIYSYLHVIDRMTGEDVDMLLDGEYSFIGSPADSDARFIVKLAYSANNVNADSDIFAFQNGTDIVVSGEGELQIFDVTGRKVMNTMVNGVQTINGLSQGVYIFRIIGETQKTQKIVVR